MSSEDIKEIKEDVKSILLILNGNGKMGLVARVSVLWGVSVYVVGGVTTALIKVFLFS